MNEFLREKLRCVQQQTDRLVERTAELIVETLWVEVGHDGGKGHKDS